MFFAVFFALFKLVNYSSNLIINMFLGVIEINVEN